MQGLPLLPIVLIFAFVFVAFAFYHYGVVRRYAWSLPRKRTPLEIDFDLKFIATGDHAPLKVRRSYLIYYTAVMLLFADLAVMCWLAGKVQVAVALGFITLVSAIDLVPVVLGYLRARDSH